MLLYVLIFLIVIVYWPTSLYWNEDILWARGVSNYIDWPVHFAQMTKIKFQTFSELYSTSPFIANTKNTYPFWADVPSGLLYRMGLGFTSSFLIPSVLYTIFFIYVVHRFLKKQGFSDLMIGTSLALFLFASMPYAVGTQPQVWLNLMSSNRSLLVSFSFILITYEIFQKYLLLEHPLPLKDRAFTFLKLIAMVFITCLIHPHSLLTMALVAVVFSLQILIKTKRVPLEFLLWGTLSLVIAFSFKHFLWSEATLNYPKFSPFWSQDRFNVNPLLFWPLYGGFVYLLGTYYAIAKKKYTDLAIILSLNLIHILFLWQFNEYDNIKNTLLIFFLCSCLISQFTKKNLLYAICFICILPSAKEWFEIYPMTTTRELILAADLQENIPKDTIVIVDNRHNHFIPMFTTLQPLSWWDYYNWTLGLAARPEVGIRYNALLKPSQFTYPKNILMVVRDESSYSPYETEGRFKPMGTNISFDQLDLKNLPFFRKEAGYTIYRRWTDAHE
jgi:hypothetical protein